MRRRRYATLVAALAVGIAMGATSCATTATTDSGPTSINTVVSPSATDNDYHFGLTVIPGLMQTPRGLAFYRSKGGLDTPDPAWKVTDLDGGSNELGFTWGSYGINNDSGTGRGPAKGGFEIAEAALELNAGDEIPILFDLRGLTPGQHIRIESLSGIRVDFEVAGQTELFDSPSRLELCNPGHMDLPDGSLIRRIDRPAGNEPFHIANCDSIPPGVYEIRQNQRLLTYVRR